ncbi:Oxidoreductase UcpA [Balamuthia mandrillaris]
MAMRGRIAVVTGGAQGIGRATALLLAAEGATVYVGDRSAAQLRELSQEAAEKNSKTEGGGGQVIGIECDLSTADGCKGFAREVLARIERQPLDLLFNNVGIQPPESRVPLHLLEEAVWDHVLSTNLRSAFLLSKLLLPSLLSSDPRARQASIINNASIQGIQSQRHCGAYAASKGALLSLTRQLACEYGAQGLRVNSISPGSVATPLMRANTAQNGYVEANTPLGRVGEPEDIARAVLWLAVGEGAKWLTGHNLVVDGGITVKGGWAAL